MIVSKLVNLFTSRYSSDSLNLEHAGKTHVGKVRQNNEDFLLMVPENGLYLVCDGMALWNEPEELGAVLGTGDGDGVVDRLIELSLVEGGKDNISCVVVSC